LRAHRRGQPRGRGGEPGVGVSVAAASPPRDVLAGLTVITAVNLWGIAESARALMLPIAVFLAALFGVIAVGLVRSHPAAVVGTAQPARVRGRRRDPGPEGLRRRLLRTDRDRSDPQHECPCSASRAPGVPSAPS